MYFLKLLNKVILTTMSFLILAIVIFKILTKIFPEWTAPAVTWLAPLTSEVNGALSMTSVKWLALTGGYTALMTVCLIVFTNFFPNLLPGYNSETLAQSKSFKHSRLKIFRTSCLIFLLVSLTGSTFWYYGIDAGKTVICLIIAALMCLSPIFWIIYPKKRMNTTKN